MDSCSASMACEAGWCALVSTAHPLRCGRRATSPLHRRENLCLDNIDGEWWGVAVELIAFVYSFVAVAIVADRHLVVSLETLCVRWNVREDVAGASFMALGSAAPEVIINAISTLKTVLSTEKHDGYVDEGDDGDDAVLGVGAILGSGMIAFTAIPGICGVAAGGAEPLLLKRRPLARDLVTYLLSISWLCYIFSDGRIEAVEAAAMLAGYVCYMLVVVYAADVRRLYRVHWLGKVIVTTRIRRIALAGKATSYRLPPRPMPPSPPSSQPPSLSSLSSSPALPALPPASLSASLHRPSSMPSSMLSHRRTASPSHSSSPPASLPELRPPTQPPPQTRQPPSPRPRLPKHKAVP